MINRCSCQDTGEKGEKRKMHLTQKEEEMLSGKLGEGARLAMSILFEMGKLYHADRFIPVSAAHIDGCCYSAVWDAGLEFAEKLADLGAKVSVPASLNISARDLSAWEKLRTPSSFPRNAGGWKKPM